MSDVKEQAIALATINGPNFEDVYVNEPGAGTSSAANANASGGGMNMEWNGGGYGAPGAMEHCPTMFQGCDPDMPRINNAGGGFWGFMRRCWYWLALYYYGTVWNFIQIWNKHQVLNMDKIPKRPSEIAVITGGERGIGLQVVKKLLQADMHVIIGTIDEPAATEAVAKLKQHISTGSCEVLPLDLAQLQSVRFFVRRVLEKDMPITVLINNAGIKLVPFRLTENEMESHFQINFHGHFLLTILLLPALMKGGQPQKSARIVNVTSHTSFGGRFHFADLQMKEFYSTPKAYMNSKLAQIVFSNYLTNQIKYAAVPPNLTVTSVHPGICMTGLGNGGFCCRPFHFLCRLIWMTAEQGADGIVYAALAPEHEGKSGHFLFNCRRYNESHLARDRGIQENLWKMSCGLAGMAPNFELIPQAEPRTANGGPATPAAPQFPPDPILVLDPADGPAEVVDLDPGPPPMPASAPPVDAHASATTCSTDGASPSGTMINGRVQLHEIIIFKDRSRRCTLSAPVLPDSHLISEISEKEVLEEVPLDEMPEITM